MGKVFLSAFLMSIIAGNAFGALPFITYDAYTLGIGISQVELWYARSTDKETVDGSVEKTDRNLPELPSATGWPIRST